ncbi:tripartite tricarboxylate transporter TctB family protein [Domibacillus indicus]|uniref:tripartite tricarboxylate transporter TctB family protein n=1 Tax=Domibacillus indicus TaxID=1437523 RepID=UPI00061832F8|nr:tripartite tricarboxylate transporter TctB family protein [Domibacillus indicus]
MNKTFDRYASIIFLVIGIFFVVESRKIGASSYGSNVGPDIFPIGLGVLLILLSIKLFIETIKMKSETGKGAKPDYKRFLIIFAAAVLYVALLEPLGYVITTFLFLVIGFQVLEKGGWVKTILIAFAFSFGIYYVFVNVLQGSLPGFPI